LGKLLGLDEQNHSERLSKAAVEKRERESEREKPVSAYPPGKKFGESFPILEKQTSRML